MQALASLQVHRAGLQNMPMELNWDGRIKAVCLGDVCKIS